MRKKGKWLVWGEGGFKLPLQREARGESEKRLSKPELSGPHTHCATHIFNTCWTAACFAHNYKHESLPTVGLRRAGGWEGAQGGWKRMTESRDTGRSVRHVWAKERGSVECESERSKTKSERTGGSLMLQTSFQLQFSLFETRNRGTKRFPVSPASTHKILFNPNMYNGVKEFDPFLIDLYICHVNFSEQTNLNIRQRLQFQNEGLYY